MAETEEFESALVRGHDFCLAGALGGLILLDRPPSDGTTAAADDKTGERENFEKFNLSTIRNGVTKLTTPARITESCEIVVFGGGKRCSICVDFLVVMIREAIEGLKRICSIGVE